MDAYQASLYTAVLIACISFGVVLFSLGLLIVQRQGRNFNRQLRYFLGEMELKENERKRIGRDLHDELGPILSLTAMQLESMRGLDAREAGLLQEATGQLREMMERLSGIARSLAPVVLVNKGLVPALEAFFRLCESSYPIRILFTHQLKQEPEVSMKTHIYRMVQEITYNTIKYAAASYIRVTVIHKRSRLFIVCKDNGKGFETDNGKGLGLENIQIRVSLLGGSMHLQSNIGKGTEYFIELPIEDYE